MAGGSDLFDQLVKGLTDVFSTGQKAIVSDAPGVGPESEREGHRAVVAASQNGRLPLGYLAAHPSKGRSATGYGGHGDPAILDTQVDAEVRQEIQESIRQAARSRLHDVRPSGRIRMSKGFSLEAHMEWNGSFAVAGPYSLFTASTGVPGAGNSIQIVPILLPAGTVSPVWWLDRYPGAMYMSVFVKSFGIQPLGSTMTGNQEIWFADPGGAVVGLGEYNPANTSADQLQNVSTLCATPITDPGTVQMGTLYINNIGIGGTAVASRYMLNLSYYAFYADPWFNEQVIVAPTPAEVVEGLRTMEANG